MIEETLRWETSVTMVSRVSTARHRGDGCPIAAGSPVDVITGSANRDEDRWDDAGEWRLDREPQHHLAFGTGPHQCLGMHLARLELRAGLLAIIERLPNLRLDPDAAATRDRRVRVPRPGRAARHVRRNRSRSFLGVRIDAQATSGLR